MWNQLATRVVIPGWNRIEFHGLETHLAGSNQTGDTVLLKKITALLSLVLMFAFASSAVAQDVPAMDPSEVDGLESGYARMYIADIEALMATPAHPYTKALVASIPPLEGERPEQLVTIAGAPPSPGAWPDGCRFRDRCSLWQLLGQPERCTTERPSLAEHDDVACHFAEVAA